MANQSNRNQSNFRSTMRRARWDRLFGALVVLILLILLIVSLAKSCTKQKDPAETQPVSGETSAATETVDLPTETEAVTPPAYAADNSRAVYLSPSNERDDIYASDGETSEAEVMTAIAEQVRDLLEKDGYTVYIGGETENVRTKINTGNELGCGAYVALRSNGADVNEASGEGCACYYNSTVSGSRALAENVYNRIAELTPSSEDRGLKDESNQKYYEILNGLCPCCLIEIEFHDNEEAAQWIIDNEDEIAKSVKDGIIAFMKNKEASAAPAGEDAEDADGAAE